MKNKLYVIIKHPAPYKGYLSKANQDMRRSRYSSEGRTYPTISPCSLSLLWILAMRTHTKSNNQIKNLNKIKIYKQYIKNYIKYNPPQVNYKPKTPLQLRPSLWRRRTALTSCLLKTCTLCLRARMTLLLRPIVILSASLPTDLSCLVSSHLIRTICLKI